MAGTRNISTIVEQTISSLVSNDSFINKLLDKLMVIFEAKLEEQKKMYEGIVADLSTQLEQQKKQHEVIFADLSANLMVLEDRLDQQEQYSRRNCVRVFGIPEQEQENTEDLVLSVFKDKLSVNVTPDLIDRCHRIGKKNIITKSSNKSKPRPIIVKFTTYKTRDEVLKNRRKLRGSPTHIKEDLTKHRLGLLKLASEKYGYKNVWSNDGIIFTNSGGTIKRVTHSDLNNV